MSAFSDMTSVSRRGFLQGTGGLVFTFAVGGGASDSAAQGAAGRLNAYVTINPNGAITIMMPAPEMGQGVNTTLPLIVAEELDADWSKVTVQQAPVAAAYNHPVFRAQYQVASLTTRGYWMPLRTAGAQARRVLIDAAAQRWGVPASELATEPSTVVHAASGRRLTYGEIAGFAQVPATLPEIKPEELKPVDRFRLLGKNVGRIDIADKSTGKQVYAIDIQVPDMLYGTVAWAPVRDSKPTSFNRDEIKAQRGIVDAVALDEGIGIVGRTVEDVFAARRKLKAVWSNAPGSKVNSAKEAQEYLTHLRDPNRKGVVVREAGDASAAIAGAARMMTGEYTSDYVYHAQMEPMCCTASVTPAGVEVWAGTQWPTKSVEEAAKAAGVTPDKVKFHTLQMGGGYGRRAFVEYVPDAVLLSKAVGKPVKMILSREDDVRNARMRPLTAQKIDVGLDASGKIVGWRHRLAAEPVTDYLYDKARLEAQKGNDIIVVAGADVPFYDVPAFVTDHVYEARGVRVAAWRGIGAGYTNFAVEGMIDELALQAGKDPLEYRMALLKDARAKKVIERVAQLSEWGRRREGRALGIAFNKLGLPPVGFSMTGTVAEISLNRASGEIRVHNLWCVADVGLPLQPDNTAAQIEGSLVFSVSAALKEQITLKNGEVQQSNYHDYPVLRMSEAPDIKVEILGSGPVPLPVGELSIGGTAPAIAGAFFALTGKRLRDLPMSPERVKKALA